jgi:hypothetical protein
LGGLAGPVVPALTGCAEPGAGDTGDRGEGDGLPGGVCVPQRADGPLACSARRRAAAMMWLVPWDRGDHGTDVAAQGRSCPGSWCARTRRRAWRARRPVFCIASISMKASTSPPGSKRRLAGQLREQPGGYAHPSRHGTARPCHQCSSIAALVRPEIQRHPGRHRGLQGLDLQGLDLPGDGPDRGPAVFTRAGPG